MKCSSPGLPRTAIRSASLVVRSPVPAILWEIGLAHRRGFAALAAAVPVCAVAAHFLAAPERNELMSALAMVSLGFCLLALFVFFTFTETSREQKVAVFPVRLFALPVKTVVLVATPMLSGAVVVGLFSLAWSKFVLAPLGETSALLRAPVILATGLMTYMATMWGMARFRLGRLFLCGVIGVVLIWGLVFPEALLPEGLAGMPEAWQRAALAAGAAVLNLAAFVWAWIAVERQRHVRVRATPSQVALPWSVTSTVQKPSRPFASSAQAQFWMEWRRNGRLLPGATILFALVAAAGLPLLIEFNGVNTLKVAGWMMLFPLALATLLGKSMAVVDFWSQEMTLPPFVAVRPQSCADIVFAKMRAAAWSAGLSWCGLLAGVGIVLGLWGDTSLVRQAWQEFRAGHSAAQQLLIIALALLAVLVLTWRQLVVSLYVGLFGRVGVFGAAVVVSFAGYFVALPWVTNWAVDQGPLRWEPTVPWQMFIWAITGTFLAKMCLAFWAWNLSCRHGLVSAHRFLRFWAFWTVSTGCLTGLVLLALPGYPWMRNCLALFFLLAVPLARPGLAPLALSANRHRKPTDSLAAGWRVFADLNLRAPESRAANRTVPIAAGVHALAMNLLVVIAAFSLAAQVPHRVGAGDCRLRLLSLGKGSPTILLESDLQSVIESWWPVIQDLARDHRVVAYDRAGRGGSGVSSGPISGERVAQRLHAALVNAKVPSPYVLVGSGVGALHARIFAHRYPREIAGIVLVDPPLAETTTDAMNWLQTNRAELMPEIRKWLQMYPAGVYGYGVREFQLAEQQLELLPPAARKAERNVRWDEVTDGTLYGMGINFGYMAPGPAEEFQQMDEIVLEDRRAWPLPAVPVTLLTGLKRGLLGSVDRPALDDFLAERKLTQHREWLGRLPAARQIVTLESGGDLLGDHPQLILQAVREMCQPLAASPRN
jgi:pimeloyl-ACP methyl ester carboxylesterase